MDHAGVMQNGQNHTLELAGGRCKLSKVPKLPESRMARGAIYQRSVSYLLPAIRIDSFQENLPSPLMHLGGTSNIAGHALRGSVSSMTWLTTSNANLERNLRLANVTLINAKNLR